MISHARLSLLLIGFQSGEAERNKSNVHGPTAKDFAAMRSRTMQR